MRDPVSGCSLAAQGLWLRLMFLMHDSERYGYLCQNSLPIPPEMLARRCGCTLDEFNALLSELESVGIPGRSQDNIIFSRRMVRDAEERAKNAERQRRYYQKHNAQPNADTNADTNGDLTAVSRKPNKHSSSSSSDNSETKVSGGKPPKQVSVIWDMGVNLLIQAGEEEQKARSFLGKLSKEHGKDKLAQALATTSAANPASPKEYLVKVLQDAKRTNEKRKLVV